MFVYVKRDHTHTLSEFESEKQIASSYFAYEFTANPFSGRYAWRPVKWPPYGKDYDLMGIHLKVHVLEER